MEAIEIRFDWVIEMDVGVIVVLINFWSSTSKWNHAGWISIHTHSWIVYLLHILYEFNILKFILSIPER